MKYPSTRIVFDRRKTATKKNPAAVHIEIRCGSRKKYVSTGVRVCLGQWKEGKGVVAHRDMFTLNHRIEAEKRGIDEWILKLVESRKPFEWSALEDFINGPSVSGETFIEYIARRIDERSDLTKGTKKVHRQILQVLADYGGLTSFQSLTRANIARFYEWMMSREKTVIGKDGIKVKQRIRQSTVGSRMKVLRIYIHDAMMNGLLDSDPSMGIKVKRGEPAVERFLTLEELRRIEETEYSSGRIVRSRDLFLMQCYSGMAYADLMDFSPEKIIEEDGMSYIAGKRKKTGEPYFVLVLPKVKEILEKYDYQLPKLSDQSYNKILKLVAEEAHIDKPISSHWGRHTAAMMFLNAGIRLETVSRILGHSSTKVTEAVYASILGRTVAEEMKMALQK